MHVVSTSNSIEFGHLLDEHPTLSRPTFSGVPHKHGIQHYDIPTEWPPVHARARRLLPKKLAIAKKEFEQLEAMGIIC